MSKPLDYVPVLAPCDASQQADEAARRMYMEARPALVEIVTDKGAGSGFFADDQGHIATAAHVVIDAAKISAKLADGRVLDAKVEKLSDTSDVAEIIIPGFDASKQKYLPLADQQQLKADQKIYALGFPRVELSGGSRNQPFISPGVSSETQVVYDLVDKDAVARRFALEDAVQKRKWLAVLAAPVVHAQMHLEPGNSGGPILNVDGQVVGISDFTRRDNHCDSFFTPIEKWKKLRDEAQQKGATTFRWKSIPFK